MIRRPPRSTPLYSSAASDVYKRQPEGQSNRTTSTVWPSSYPSTFSGMITNPSALAIELSIPDPDAIDADIKMGSTHSFCIATRAYVRELGLPVSFPASVPVFVRSNCRSTWASRLIAGLANAYEATRQATGNPGRQAMGVSPTRPSAVG